MVTVTARWGVHYFNHPSSTFLSSSFGSFLSLRLKVEYAGFVIFVYSGSCRFHSVGCHCASGHDAFVFNPYIGLIIDSSDTIG